MDPKERIVVRVKIGVWRIAWGVFWGLVLFSAAGFIAYWVWAALMFNIILMRK
jgi:hypothetical protein